MTLDQLRVDSYATQVSETELTEIKGGSWFLCSCASSREVAHQETVNSSSGGSTVAGFSGDYSDDNTNYSY